MKTSSLNFLKTLLETPTPSGHEACGQQLIADYVKPYADSVELDNLGNLHAVVNPGAPFRVMLDAHCDEIGFMVQYIDKHGMLYFVN